MFEKGKPLTRKEERDTLFVFAFSILLVLFILAIGVEAAVKDLSKKFSVWVLIFYVLIFAWGVIFVAYLIYFFGERCKDYKRSKANRPLTPAERRQIAREKLKLAREAEQKEAEEAERKLQKQRRAKELLKAVSLGMAANRALIAKQKEDEKP